MSNKLLHLTHGKSTTKLHKKKVFRISAVQSHAVQCSAMQCSAVPCRAVLCSAVHCTALHFSVVQQCSAVVSKAAIIL